MCHEIVANCRDIFCPVPFPLSPFGFRRDGEKVNCLCTLRGPSLTRGLGKCPRWHPSHLLAPMHCNTPAANLLSIAMTADPGCERRFYHLLSLWETGKNQY